MTDDRLFFEVEKIDNGFILKIKSVADNDIKKFCDDLEKLLAEIRIKIKIWF